MLGNDLAAILPELQAHARSRMGASNGGSDATVKRPAGDGPIEGTDEYGPTFTTLYESLPCRIATERGFVSPSRTVTVAGGAVTLAVRTIHFPHGTAHFKDGDLIEITSGANAGTSWLVIEADAADQQTAYRVPVVAYS